MDAGASESWVRFSTLPNDVQKCLQEEEVQVKHGTLGLGEIIGEAEAEEAGLMAEEDGDGDESHIAVLFDDGAVLENSLRAQLFVDEILKLWYAKKERKVTMPRRC